MIQKLFKKMLISCYESLWIQKLKLNFIYNTILCTQKVLFWPVGTLWQTPQNFKFTMHHFTNTSSNFRMLYNHTSTLVRRRILTRIALRKRHRCALQLPSSKISFIHTQTINLYIYIHTNNIQEIKQIQHTLTLSHPTTNYNIIQLINTSISHFP